MQNSESGTLKVLLRLVPFAKKAIPRLILGMLAGIAAHMFALAIPQLLQDLVNSLVSGGLDALLPAVGLILFLGVLEALFVLLRRWLVLTPGTYVEADMRNKLYEKLQDLPVAFHDRWP
ncbi:MAG: ABC transporter ATP-binding protein, partial [Actinobacteria bacterium]|nr:ABC transporter ATP-binding protein [Actinomycetota bacterium]